jgi:glycosyltransferase involved in cell wall biosynthesis
MHPPQATVDVFIPVLNEAHVLERSVNTVREYLRRNLPYRWQVVIIDNGSTDGTQDIAGKLAAAHEDVGFVHLTQRGRGRALRHGWLQSKADVVCYMDVDLSTDLIYLNQLIDAIVKEGYDVATGSRLLSNSVTKRCFKREVTSRVYNLIVKMVLFTRFSDAQCGFKAVSRDAVEQIVPQVEDQSWFFDTELLVLAEKHGYRIKDIPVVWIEDDDSRVKIVRTALDDLKGILRLRAQLWKAAFGGASLVAVKRSLNR